MSQLTQYWDSTVFVAFFNREPRRSDLVKQLLEEAESGNITIITSSFALVEVLKVEGHKPLSAEAEAKIVDFFEHEFIRIVDATRTVCEDARHLIWQYPALHPKDSVHLASALTYAKRAALDHLFSYDTDFLKLNGKITTKFPILEPFISQADMFLGKPQEKPSPPHAKETPNRKFNLDE